MSKITPASCESICGAEQPTHVELTTPYVDGPHFVLGKPDYRSRSHFLISDSQVQARIASIRNVHSHIDNYHVLNIANHLFKFDFRRRLIIRKLKRKSKLA